MSNESLRQEQQLALQQRLNPQNVALGRVLEMSVPEFEDEVRRELDDNPALEAVEPENDTTDDFGESSEQLQLADYADDDDAPAYLAGNSSADDRHVEVASYTADDEESMGEILLRRLAAETDLDDTDMRVAAHIIGNFDDNGYLTRPLRDITDDIAIAEGMYVDASACCGYAADCRVGDSSRNRGPSLRPLFKTSFRPSAGTARHTTRKSRRRHRADTGSQPQACIGPRRAPLYRQGAARSA